MVVALAFLWVALFAVLPFAIWHQVLADILSSFHWSFGYLVGELSPWFLLLGGVAFMVPVALSVGRDPDSRLYPRARRAYFAWGTVLYLLGLLLVVQVWELWKYAH